MSEPILPDGPIQIAPQKSTPADLLAKADALMRKNRTTEEDDIPVLDMQVTVHDEPISDPSVVSNWDAVCETVYHRVMQQMDLYTQFGLRDRVSRELRPRMIALAEQMGNEIANDVADNIRKYVAQAVDEEVARLRMIKK
jgi:hypothetical protein